MCFEGEQACLNKSYDRNNITQIAEIQLGTMRQGSLEFALRESLTFPTVETMNCEELCNCLSCGHGQCSDNIDQEQCLGTHLDSSADARIPKHSHITIQFYEIW